MSQFRRIRLAFEAAEREGGGAQPSAAAPVTPTESRAQGPRQTVSKSTTARSSTTPPLSGNRPILKNSPKSTKTGSSRILQTSTKVRHEDGGIVIAVMGAIGSGKSYFCRVATGGDDIGVGGRPGSRTLEPTRHQVMLRTDDGDRLVTLLDIPGFKGSSHNNTTVPDEKAQAVALRNNYAQGRKFSGILYFCLISDIRMEGLAITDTQLKAFHELCGDDSGTLKNVILATNRWDLVESEDAGIQRQDELQNDPRYWKPMCLQGSQVRRFGGTRESALDLIRLVMHNTPRPLKILQDVVNENKLLAKTGARRLVEAEIDKLLAGREQTLAAIKEMELVVKKKDGAMQMLLKEESERSKKEVDELRKQQEVMKADDKNMFTLLSEERKRVDTIREEMELALQKKDDMQMLLKEEAERSKKEIDELRRQQEIMRADNQKVLTLLYEERELRKEERDRMENEVTQLKVDIDARAQAETAEFRKMKEKQLELALQISRLQVEVEKEKANNEQVRQGIRKLWEETQDTSDTSPGDVISALQALQIKGVRDKDMREILNDVLAKHEVKEWGSLLAAAPNVLNATGKCFIVALSGEVEKITQQGDKSIPADLRTNLVRCSDLGLGPFVEAEDRAGNLRKTITAITENRGIIDKILDAVADIKSATESKSEEDLRAGREELTQQRGDLRQRAQACTKDTESVAKKISQCHLEVTKISEAFTEVQERETASRGELETEIEDLLVQLKKIENGGENARLLGMRVGFTKRSIKDKSTALEGIRSYLESLNAQRMDKENVIKVLGSCLDNFEQIRESLKLLDRFFNGLHDQIENLSEIRLPTFIRDVSRKNLTQSKLDDIHYDAYKIRFQYMHADNKAKVYVEASQKYIMPGVKLLNSFNSGTEAGGSDTEGKLLQLGECYENSLKGIRVFAERLPTIEQLMRRIENVGLSLGD